MLGFCLNVMLERLDEIYDLALVPVVIKIVHFDCELLIFLLCINSTKYLQRNCIV